MERKKKAQDILTIIFIVILVFLAYTNCMILRDPIKKFKEKQYTFSETKDAIVTAYVEQLEQKYWFINLNGLFVRLTGGRVCNDIVLLKNGMLTDSEVKAADTSHNAHVTAELAEQLKDLHIDFLYVQAPAKVDKNNELCPQGIVNEGNNNVDQLIQELENKGVSVLDLREEMIDTKEHISEYYYRTDHHWNPLGAFKAFQEISDYLQALYPDENINGYYQNINNWEVHRKEKWFLGSRGKRTGIYFAGVDDLIWLTPKFETEMSFANVYGDDFRYGDYYEANIREEYIKEKDYFKKNAYCVYIGGNYRLVKHLNNSAPVDKKMLIVKDSYSLPLETYLSTVFKEVEVIDMRHYELGSLDGYILDNMPDIVLMNFYTYGVGIAKLFGTGADVNVGDLGEPKRIYEKDSVVIKRDDKNDSNYVSVYDNIEAGKRYMFKCDSVSVSEGSTDGISIKLYDKENESFYNCEMWDLSYCAKNDSYEWIFTVPKDVNNLELIVYSGIAGNTSGAGITISGIELFQYVNN